MTSGAVEVRPGMYACPGPALWVAAERSLLIADLHLGYAWAQRRRGQLGPLAKGDVRERVLGLIDRFQPKRLIVVGDLVHAPRPSGEERMEIESTVGEIGGRCEVILVRGNHDRGFARDFGNLRVEVVDSWEGDGYVAAHGDSGEFRWPEGSTAVLGHWHPAASVKDAAGARIRYPAFLVWPGAIVLPAFSPFSKGLDIGRGIPGGLSELVGDRSAPHCVVVTLREAIWLKRDSRVSRNSSLSGAWKGGGVAPRKLKQAKKSESSRC